MGNKRQFRKKQVRLAVGDKEVKGEVIAFDPEKKSGFIRPDNGAGRIHFSVHNTALSDMECVGVGSVVHFDVMARFPIRSRKKPGVQLSAEIRSSGTG